MEMQTCGVAMIRYRTQPSHSALARPGNKYVRHFIIQCILLFAYMTKPQNAVAFRRCLARPSVPFYRSRNVILLYYAVLS